jgi:hypothetical protein
VTEATEEFDRDRLVDFLKFAAATADDDKRRRAVTDGAATLDRAGGHLVARRLNSAREHHKWHDAVEDHKRIDRF